MLEAVLSPEALLELSSEGPEDVLHVWLCLGSWFIIWLIMLFEVWLTVWFCLIMYDILMDIWNTEILQMFTFTKLGTLSSRAFLYFFSFCLFLKHLQIWWNQLFKLAVIESVFICGIKLAIHEVEVSFLFIDVQFRIVWLDCFWFYDLSGLICREQAIRLRCSVN